MKKFFRNKDGDIHFGDKAPDGFSVCVEKDAIDTLRDIKDKCIWRCNVCNDLHIGKAGPKQCPTCFVIEAYIQINEKEFLGMIK